MFCCFSGAEATTMNLPSDVVGARTEFDITKTLEMARRLQPDARKLVVMGGSSDFDRSWIATAREDLGELAKNYETTYLTDLSIDEFVERASHLSADTILLVLTVSADRTGRNFIPRDALEKIAGAASAPTYGPYSTYVGFGVVGGNTVTFEAMGTTVADLAVDALAGKPIADVDVPQTYVADARQLMRWGLSESRLPPGTVQSFKEKSLWEEHWVSDRRYPRRHRVAMPGHRGTAGRASPAPGRGTAVARSSSRVGSSQPVGDGGRAVGIDRS